MTEPKPSCCGPVAQGDLPHVPELLEEGPMPAYGGAARGLHRSDEEQRRLLARLKRIEGQVAAIRRMVEADAYCVNVLTQVAAARGALAKVGEEVLQRHVETCVAAAFTHGDADARQEKIDELMDVFARDGGRGGA